MQRITLGCFHIEPAENQRYPCTGILDIHQLREGVQLLGEMGYSKQVNQKMEQLGIPSPNRNEQFEFIDWTAHAYLVNGDSVISADTKKKENIGSFKNNGAEYRKEKDSRRVLDLDFPIPELGKVAPYGVCVLNDNTGFINLGISHDTSEFAVSSISYWWLAVG